jgi:hypothetical protein
VAQGQPVQAWGQGEGGGGPCHCCHHQRSRVCAAAGGPVSGAGFQGLLCSLRAIMTLAGSVVCLARLLFLDAFGSKTVCRSTTRSVMLKRMDCFGCLRLTCAPFLLTRTPPHDCTAAMPRGWRGGVPAARHDVHREFCAIHVRAGRPVQRHGDPLLQHTGAWVFAHVRARTCVFVCVCVCVCVHVCAHVCVCVFVHACSCTRTHALCKRTCGHRYA